MALIMVSLEEFLKRLTNGEMLWGCILFLGLFFSIAFVLGVVVGWTWKPKWVNLSRDKLDSVMTKTLPSSSNSSLITAPLLRLGSIPKLDSFQSFISRNSDNGRLGSIPRLDSFQSFISRNSDNGEDKEDTLSVELTLNSDDCSASQSEKQLAVTDEDVKHLCQLVEGKDGGPAWMQMMDRSTPTMAYQAWRREPEIGPTQYRSRTVYEDVTPELMRDFFWDDEFRSEWDDMLIYSETLEECPTTGITVAHWIRKFPFFCSDREYIIGRRIWESGRSYYCVTKGVPYPSMTRRNKPRRVDLYYSSWYIRAVESESGNGQLTACEVLLFHHEDMGIPREIAKLGIRQGMWGAVKKIDPGLRAYQRVRASGAPLSRCAIMAQLNTKINADYLRSLEANASDISEVETLNPCEKPSGANIPKLLFVGGAVVLACSLDRGLLVKAVIFGVARSFTKIGKRKL